MNNKALPARQTGCPQAGFSMIEMMISVSVGLLVMAAVVYTVTNSGISGRKQEVKVAGHDEGNLAMVQLAEYLRISGFNRPDSEVVAPDVFADGSASIFGCQSGFVDPSQPWDDLRCAPRNPRLSEAIALRFHPGGEGGRNWDCMGNTIIDEETAGNQPAANNTSSTQNNNSTVIVPGALVFNEVQEVFYVKTSGTASGNPGLYCRSNTVPGKEQLIADNVDQFRLTYGLAPIDRQAQAENKPFDPPVLEGRTAMYRNASQLDRNCTPGEMPDNSWCAVNSVQLCLVMRSQDNVNEEANTPYVDCNGRVQQVNDRRLRQAFTMTVAVRNKVTEGAAGQTGAATP
ncbi:MAG: PilW family protein [Lautropia sp.]|nr:PilW family protein [Lautropia sp.]